jgi:PHD/YefM family antitoxin component YafN of YafNO toxin-antitoxin module
MSSRTNADELLKRLATTQAPMVLMKNDTAVAVVQDFEQYKKLTDAVLFLKLVVQGEKEYQEGKGADQEVGKKQISR